LVRTQTQASGTGQAANELSAKDGINYNLVKCIFILFKEQVHLWKWFLVLLVAALAGGGMAKLASTFDQRLHVPQQHSLLRQSYSHESSGLSKCRPAKP
jgi:hypothetical protein